MIDKHEAEYAQTAGPLLGRLLYKYEDERFPEDLEYAAEAGMDIGDYDFIDKHLYHCPTVDWVQ